MGNEGSITNMSANEKQKDDLRAYLLSTRDYWGAYRSLKENALWPTTTIYLGFLAALDSFMLQYIIGWRLKIGAIFLVLVTLILVVLYSKKLTEDRIYASDILAYCDAMLGMLLDPKFKLDRKLDFEQPYKTAKNTKEYIKKLLDLLKAPDWTWIQEKRRWNLWSPSLAVYLWTLISVALICFR